MRRMFAGKEGRDRDRAAQLSIRVGFHSTTGRRMRTLLAELPAQVAVTI